MKRHFSWHLLYWLIPVLAYLSTVIASFMGPEAAFIWAESPYGFLENAPSLAIFAATIYCLALLRKPEFTTQGNAKYWIIAYIAAMVYFAGEDENWGQYWFNWDVPDYFMKNNKEFETNIHNISGWFNQKPRLICEIWIITVGILVPLGWVWPKRVTQSFVPEFFWIKDKDLMFLAVITILTRIWDAFGKHFPAYDLNDVRLSEVQEMLIGYFMLVYILKIWDKFKKPRT